MVRYVRAVLGAGGVIFCAAAVFIAAQPRSTAKDPNRAISLTGVNISGAEFGTNIPGVSGKDYFYPRLSMIDYFAKEGMNIIRLPLLWERIQHRLWGKLDEKEMARIDDIVAHANSKGLKVIIDIHNYAKYFNSTIGTTKVPVNSLGNLWSQIAERYKSNDSVVFGLMNEPTQLRTETWLEAVNDAIAQIREAGAKNLILVPGNGWSSARDWTSGKYGIPNSQVMLNVVDRDNNYVFDVHQYFDRDFTGTHQDCQSAKVGVQTLTPFTRWAREHNQRGFLGEFGVGRNSTCLKTLNAVLKFMAVNNDVWIGWTYWAGGMWPENYFTNIDPVGGKDRPQMLVLKKYIHSGSER